ncbi:conserved exported hypothetical protein [uncultured Paludibacter sp.]|uniref:DUF6443 domain-containing protein n=1 Tax=uncultured Paludibacter sp. TaxID=497635 RepID=A0A653ABF9_9BACT|nr:conserved exported hypothetical protein [uncultured Paludibacter sp.]
MKIKHIINIFILVSTIAIQSFAQSADQNYIKTVAPTIAVTDASNLTTSQSLQTIQYFDGLGRPVETIQKNITPLGKDLVTLTEYDGVGREQFQWLPKIMNGSGAFVDPTTFKNTVEPLYNGDANPFTEIVYEPSPLNRVKEQFGAGNAWKTGNKRVTTSYGANESEVKYFYADNNNQLVADGAYNAATLYKTTTKDEDGKQTVEYKDKLGRIVMQRTGNDADTYYVYNDLGQLAYVLPPLAADASASVDFADAVNKYGYIYKYDKRGNCDYKKLPGCEPIYMAYDKADRLIASQDGNQRTKNQWTITKYDILGRIIYTATLTRQNTLAQMEATLNPLLIIESYTGTTSFANTGYTCGYFINELTPLTVNYYDNYSFISVLASTIQTNLKYIVPTAYSKAYPESATDISSLNSKGLLTGTRTYFLDGSGNYTTAVNYYDDKARIVQTRSTNHLGGYDIVYNDLDFTGKPNKTLKEHNIAINGVQLSIVSELYTYEYDHAQRLLKTKYQINNKPEVILTDMTTNGYDELGRLKTKKRHNGTDTESFQYNIRNWTTKINSGTFEENLYYNTKPSNIDQATPCYNGNICYSTWTYNGGTRGYEYEYDELNRYTGGYAYNNNEILVDYQYSEWFNYNKMGNITHLLRHGDGGEFYDLDNLSFTYNGNQLIKVDDENSYNIYNVKEYQDKANQTNEMAYDANGNLIKDLDRDIYTIKYNLLNLPEVVQFKDGHQIINQYDASGKKLSSRYYTILMKSEVPVINTLQVGQVLNLQYNMDIIDETGTFYVDNFEYGFNGCDPGWYWVDKVYNAEGYVTRLDYGANYYYYFRKDHLGNNREVWLANTGATVQRTQYYPSGLPWAEGTGQDVQNKKYNGKEFVEAHGLDEYDSEARWYYPAIMRTTTLDPLAEKYYSISPYVWCGNNPVNRVDLNGMDWYEFENKDGIKSVIWQEGNAETIDINGQTYNDIGENYTRQINAYTSITYTQNEVTSMTYTGINEDNFVAQGTGTGCKIASDQMLANEGVNSRGERINVVNADANGVATAANANAARGIDAVDKALENGNPIEVGVDYKSKQVNNIPPNGDGMTDHFIVISSKTETLSNGQVTSKTYNFFDPRSRQYGTDATNILRVNNNKMTGYYRSGSSMNKPYTVTTIRKSR